MKKERISGLLLQYFMCAVKLIAVISKIKNDRRDKMLNIGTNMF